MTRLPRILAAAALVAVALVATPAPAADAAAKCADHWSYDEETYEPYGFDDKWIKVFSQIHYDHCAGRFGKHWVVARSLTIGYNKQGAETGCGWGDRFERVHFNVYISDRAGNVINPGPMVLECSKDTEAERTYLLPNTKLYRCLGSVPRWVNDIKIEIQGDPDTHGTLAGLLWGFVGATKTTGC